MEGLRWKDVAISADENGEHLLQLNLVRSKTDQFNEGHRKTLRGTGHPLCPVRAFARWLNLQTGTIVEENFVFDKKLRRQLANSLKRAAVANDLDHAHISNHSVRSGGPR